MPISTKFNKIPYSIAGDSLVSEAKDISVQRTKNMFAVASPNALSTASLVSVFGLSRVYTVGASPDRGIYKRLFLGLGWRIVGTTLYSFDSAYTHTNIGTIGGSGMVSIADNGTVLVIVTNNTMYSCDGTTITTVTLPFTPIHLEYINSQFLVLDDDNTVWVSDVGTTTFDAANTYQAESLPDDLVGLRVFNQVVFNGGSRSIEPWENTGVGNPPFDRMNGAIIEDVGIANKFCMTVTSKSMYFLGSDAIPYSLVSFQVQKLTDQNFGIAELFASYDKSTAYIESWKMKGQDIIGFFFPTDSKVWCLSEDTGLWFELDHDVDSQMYIGKTNAFLFGKILWGDRVNGNLYEMKSDVYRNDSATMVRERVFRPISGASVGAIREYLQMRMVQFAVETGIGDADTVMMVSYSFDGGRNFSNESWVKLGETGDYLEKVEDYRNTKFKDLAVKIRYTENTRFSLYDAAIYVKGTGK